MTATAIVFVVMQEGQPADVSAHELSNLMACREWTALA
jgi:hypothetical protein